MRLGFAIFDTRITYNREEVAMREAHFPYIAEKLHAAVRILMIPVRDHGDAVAGAFHEFQLAVKPDTDLDNHEANRTRDRIYELLDDDGPWRDVASGFTDDQLREFTRGMFDIFMYALARERR